MEQAYSWEGADQPEATEGVNIAELFDGLPPGCPWCGNWKTLTLAVYPMWEGPKFAIMCEECSAVGPEAESAPEAASQWAMRAADKITPEAIEAALQDIQAALREVGDGAG